MDKAYSSGSDLDLDVDLESGGTTSEEDTGVLMFENSKKVSGRTNDVDCSCSYDKCMTSDEISTENTENLGKLREEMIDFGHKSKVEEKPTKKKKKHSKPPRPPRGPSLGASDMKLLKEISELNMKRRRLERSRLKKIRKEKTSSSTNSNLFACLVTIVFVLVIIFQGLLGSRT